MVEWKKWNHQEILTDQERDKKYVEEQEISSEENSEDTKKTESELIAYGKDKEVYLEPSLDNSVRIVYKKAIDAYRLKATFYYNKILHILFPNNIPLIKRVGKGEDGNTYLIAEKVEHSPEHSEIHRLRLEISQLRHEVNLLEETYQQMQPGTREAVSQEIMQLNNEIDRHVRRCNSLEFQIKKDSRMKSFFDKMDDAGIDVDSLDDSGVNYNVSSDEDFMYMELNPPWNEPFGYLKSELDFDENKLIAAINKLNNQVNKDLCLRYLERIHFLHDKEFEDRNKR